MGDIVEKIMVVILTILTIALIAFCIWLGIFIGTGAKMAKNAEYIARCNRNIYYISHYEIHDDEIWATDVEGKRIVFPKNNTVIEENN
jgi:hypothetical protein